MLILLCLRTSKISTSALYLFYRTAAITPRHHHAIAPSSAARYYATTLSRLGINTPSRLQVLHATAPLPFLASASSRHRTFKYCTLLRHYPFSPPHHHAIAPSSAARYCATTLSRLRIITPSRLQVLHATTPLPFLASASSRHRAFEYCTLLRHYPFSPRHHHAIAPSSTARYYATTLSRLRIITPSRLRVLHATTPRPFHASARSSPSHISRTPTGTHRRIYRGKVTKKY